MTPYHPILSHSRFARLVAWGILLTLLVAGSASFAADGQSSKDSPNTSCGNGLLEAAESCESCPDDCKPRPCEVSQQQETFVVDLAVPLAHQANSVTVRLGYKGDSLSFPGNGAETSKERIKALDTEAVLVPIDLDYALRVVVAQAGGFKTPTLFNVTFDRCKNSKELTQKDLSCRVEGCAGSGGPIPDCHCTVRQLGSEQAASTRLRLD